MPYGREPLGLVRRMVGLLGRPQSPMEMAGDVIGLQRGMQQLRKGEIESQNALLRNLLLRRDLAGPSEREKFQAEQRHRQIGYVLNTYMDLMKTASPASKKVFEEQFKTFAYSLSPMEQQPFQALLAYSPINENRQKLERYKELFPRPKVTADPGTDPYGYAYQAFQVQDWEDKMKHFATGIAHEPAKILPLGPDVWGLRNSEGKVSVASGDELGLEALAEKYETTIPELVANNFKIPGKSRLVTKAGVMKKITPVYDIESRSTRVLEEPTEIGVSDLRESYGKFVKEVSNFIDAVAVKGSGFEGTQAGRTWAAVEELLKKGRGGGMRGTERAVRMLENRFPGWHFYFTSERGEVVQSGALTDWSTDIAEDLTVTAWYGNPMQIKTKKMGERLVYVNPLTGVVYNNKGVVAADSLASIGEEDD